RVRLLEIEAGAQGVLAIARWRDITLGTEHGLYRGASFGCRQAGDLPADPLERQPGALVELRRLGRASQADHGRLRQQSLAVEGQPLSILAAQLQRLLVAVQLDAGALGHPAAECRRAGPAG